MTATKMLVEVSEWIQIFKHRQPCYLMPRYDEHHAFFTDTFVLNGKI